jgi:RNA recognition motif-containing protein
MNIYVGNLSLATTEEDLRREFGSFGEVMSVTVMNDRYIGSGQQRGYGYVEMPSSSEAELAVRALNGKKLGQMTISVVEALPLSENKGKGYSPGRRSGNYSNRVRERKNGIV